MGDIATRQAYGEALAELGKEMDIVVLDADLSKSTKTETFKKAFPERFINCGIAEGNMVTVAAGLATTGKVVFCSSFAMFASGRAYEQVRNAIGYPHLPVTVAATHAGISVGEDGATHQCNEDIGVMRTIPGMTIISPSDAVSTKAFVKLCAEHDGPVYLRLGRLAVSPVYEEGREFEIGKGYQLTEGNDITLIATGLMVQECVKAAYELKGMGINARVIDMPTIKPIDKDIIIKAAKETGRIITAEEHNIIGGLGSAVAEVLSENCPCMMKRIGVNDEFGKSGNAKEVLKLFGLSAENVVKTAKEMLNK